MFQDAIPSHGLREGDAMTPIRETIARAITDDAWGATYEMGRTSEPITGGAAHIHEREAGRIADSVLRALEAEGWRVVPNEPDQRMVGAYITSVRGMPRADRRLRDLTHKEWSKQHAEKCAFRWRAMLAAAPKVTE